MAYFKLRCKLVWCFADTDGSRSGPRCWSRSTGTVNRCRGWLILRVEMRVPCCLKAQRSFLF